MLKTKFSKKKQFKKKVQVFKFSLKDFEASFRPSLRLFCELANSDSFSNEIFALKFFL
jgi:hypothetical protein